MIGKSISHYRILEKLGEGGMGVVYKAEDTNLERTVAVKFLRPEVTDSEETNARFLQEAKAAARLDHPHICTVHEIDQVEGQTLMAMAYVDGPSLKERIEERPLKIDEALEIALQIGDGLAAAHEAGIVHRDIKPGNILLNSRGQVKILDFGLAHLGAATRMTKTGTIIGTPGYMAPEQVRGDSVDRRADVWAFGVVLYEMVTGRLPFQGETAQTMALMIQNETPEPVTALRSGVPIELDRVVGKSLAKDPKERYQNVEDLLVDLRSTRRQSVSAASSQWESAAPQKRRVPVLAWVVGLGAVLLAAGGGMWLWRSPKPTPITLQTPVPLTSYPGQECHASFSPDGNQITFCWNGPNQDNFDIYVKLVGPGDPINLTDHPAAEGYPKWSPDGRHIAFLRQVAPGRLGVYVIPALGGSEARKVAEIPGSVAGVPHGGDGVLAWSPDSKWLLGGKDGLTLWSVTTGEEVVLAARSEGWRYGGPTFSPDGRSLAFVGGGQSSQDIHVLPLREDLMPVGDSKQLTDGIRIGSAPLWSDDGSEILFGVSEGQFGWRSTVSFWKVRSDGATAPEQIDAAKQNVAHPAVSWPSGRLVYSQGELNSNIWSLDLSTSAAEKVGWMSSTRLEYEPDFSPDGKRVAVASARSGVHEIWLYDRDRPRARQLTHFRKGISSSPAWSPDGTKIAFDSNAGEDAGWDIYVVGAEGGALLRITTHPVLDGKASWSRDGKWIYFSSSRSGSHEVWKVEAGGGEPIQVTTNGGGFPLGSPDGKRLYYVQGTDLFSIPVEGGTEEKVLDSVWRGCYAVGREGIYFVRRASTSRYTVELFDLETSTTRVLREQREPIAFGLTVSPDGSEVLLSQIDEQEYDLMLVENLPF